MPPPDPGAPILFHAPIGFAPAPGSDPSEVILRIAGIECRFDSGLVDWGDSAAASTDPIGPPPQAHEIKPAFAQSLMQPQGQGWLGERLRDFRVQSEGSGRRVEFGPDMVFRLNAAGDRIDCISVPSAARLRREWLFGPALLLALAARGIYALHASALAVAAGAVLLLGPSGSGKSTLAGVASSLGWGVLADDVVPLCDRSGRTWVRPRFPQLKWRDPLATADCELPLAALVFVERGEAADRLLPIAISQVTRNLVRDTVAARLFAPAELAAQLAFCARLAGSCPCRVLSLREVAPRDVEAEARAALLEIAGLIGR